MTKYLVLSGMGPDKKGIAKAISEAAFNSGCSIEDSRMAKLGGEFAILALISGDEKALEAFREQEKVLETGTGLALTLRETSALPTANEENNLPFKVTVVGLDRTGIVFRVTNLLVRHGVNIGSLETESRHAPVSGTPIFHLSLIAEVPASVSVRRLREELGDLCDELNMDYSLEAI
jgi:glycine cleavage system transcriptional repressor